MSQPANPRRLKDSLRLVAQGVGVLLMWPLLLMAQPPAPATSSPSKEPAKAESKPEGIRPSGSDEVELIGPNGHVVRLPLTATLENVLRALKQQNGNGVSDRKFSVTRISLEGAVETNDEFVTLTAGVAISVLAEDTDVLVPMKLNEATLLKVEHTGANEPAFDRFDNEQGYRWRLRGKGDHELKLTLAVPVRRQGASRRVLLSLPDPPVSEITLTVPPPRVSVKVPERAVSRVRAIDNGRSEIKAFGFDRLLDLSWQGVTVVSEMKPELQVNTFVSADVRSESLVLEATQLVRSIQGTFDKLTVRLPPEFELLDVSGADVKEHHVTSDSPPRVQIELSAPTSGPVKIDWVFAAKLPVGAKSLPVIDGLEVEDARKQSGFVAVVGWEGISLRRREGEDRFLHRASPSELQAVPQGFLPSGMNNANVTIYRFLKQPFRLVLDAQAVEPYFSVEPRHVVRLQSEQADLESRLRLQVHRGALHEFQLPWPTVKADGWDTMTSDTPDLVEDVSVVETPTGSALRIRLLDRKVRSDGPFEIRLKSKRAIPTDGTEFGFSLPAVSASGQHGSSAAVLPADNLSLDWTPHEGTTARPAKLDAATLEQLPSRRNVVTWHWDTGSPMFAVKAKVQQQTIKAESLSELTLNPRTIGVLQRIRYDIAYEGLSQFRLMIPRSVANRVRFSWQDSAGESRPLTPVFTGIEIDQARQCRLQLESPQLGPVEVLAEFELDRPDEPMSDSPPALPVPVLLSSDVDYSATRVRWRIDETLTASINHPDWKPELGSDKTSVWGASGAKGSIPVIVQSAGESALQDFAIERATIRSVLQEGRVHSRALFELDREVRELSLVLPTDISPRDFRAWWNLNPVERTEQVLPTGEVELQLQLDPRPKGSVSGDAGKRKRELWIEFYSQRPTTFRWSNSHELAVPRFAPNVWVAQTIWEFVLPADQHLLTLPHDYAAQFHWQRSLLMWQRQPNAGYDRIERSLASASPLKGELMNFAFTDGNAYAVSCFGPPQPLQFRSMNGSAVVGCGAGFALLLGFILIRMPATRHVLTFLIVGFGLSVASLWYSEPVHVLLQPAILGAVMAVAAAWIDRVGRRDRNVPLVTLSSPSDFYGRGSSIVSVGGAMVDPEAPTAAPGSLLPSQPISASGTGGRQ